MDSNVIVEYYDPHGCIYMLPKQHHSKPYTCGKRHRDFLLGFLPRLSENPIFRETLIRSLGVACRMYMVWRDAVLGS
jgi:hypothetical protein